MKAYYTVILIKTMDINAELDKQTNGQNQTSETNLHMSNTLMYNSGDITNNGQEWLFNKFC